MLDGRALKRHLVRDAHVVLDDTGLTRDKLFAIVYYLHLFVPAVGIYMYIRYPSVRVAVVLTLCFIVTVQMYTRTCPIAKLEWTLMPEARDITWKGADFLEHFGFDVSNEVKFYFMVFSTLLGFVHLYVLNRLFPKGL